MHRSKLSRFVSKSATFSASHSSLRTEPLPWVHPNAKKSSARRADWISSGQFRDEGTVISSRPCRTERRVRDLLEAREAKGFKVDEREVQSWSVGQVGDLLDVERGEGRELALNGGKLGH
jgi:hypothetical protein